MLPKLSSFLLLILCAYLNGSAQSCTTLGQNPSTAFPVCGTATFTQDTVPYCGGKRIPGPCSIDDVVDTNPFWYKFTCYAAGTLGFTITPNDPDDDYDWQIFDITGFDENEIYTNTALFVACNWSGNPGLTGASSLGRSLQIVLAMPIQPSAPCPRYRLAIIIFYWLVISQSIRLLKTDINYHLVVVPPA